MAEIRDYVDIAVKAIEERKGFDIKVLNIQGISPLADYFVIGSGSNPNQLHAMADEVMEQLSKAKVHPKQTEGYNNAGWILIDYGDFIVHIFNKEEREYYNLEKIWKDAKTE